MEYYFSVICYCLTRSRPKNPLKVTVKLFERHFSETELLHYKVLSFMSSGMTLEGVTDSLYKVSLRFEILKNNPGSSEEFTMYS